MTRGTREALEVAISYILIVGVLASLTVEAVGIVAYYLQTGSFRSDFTSEWQLGGPDFFAYTAGLILSLAPGFSAFHMMALGIVLLMLTPYVRVLASVAYFGWTGDFKYLAITVFVLCALTFSLITH